MPMTILPVVSKVLGKVCDFQLQCNLRSNSLLSPEQHAYQLKKTTKTAWLEIKSIPLAGLEVKKVQERQNSNKVSNYISNPVNVMTGVWEGSVLGPIIFLFQRLEVLPVETIVD